MKVVACDSAVNVAGYHNLSMDLAGAFVAGILCRRLLVANKVKGHLQRNFQ